MAAHITGDAGQMELASSLAETVLSLPSTIPQYTSMARAALALRAVQLGDRRAAADHYAALLSVQGILLLYISIDRLLGMLAHTMNQLEASVRHFEKALAFCRNANYGPELAWTGYDYATALFQRSWPGDQAKAMVLLEESLSLATALGMEPVIDRVTTLRQRQNAVSLEATPSFPDGLTRREVEVLRLVSAGKTDREISEELFVSVRTVGGHVSNILNKTGSANRTEAAAYAIRNGLL